MQVRIDIEINGVDAKNFASQGQTRTAALSIKLAEVEIFKELSGEYPVLILDDVIFFKLGFASFILLFGRNRKLLSVVGQKGMGGGGKGPTAVTAIYL